MRVNNVIAKCRVGKAKRAHQTQIQNSWWARAARFAHPTILFLISFTLTACTTEMYPQYPETPYKPPQPKPVVHHTYKPKPPFTITVNSGSLKQNIIRIVRPYHWHVVWKSRYDYTVVGNMRIRANSLQNALKQLVKPYPVQAIFYKGNKVLLIQPRVV